MIRLVALSAAHLKYVMTWVNDEEVTQYFAGLQRKITEAEEQVFLEKMIASPNDKVFSVFDGKTYVGQVAINGIHKPSGEGRLFLVIVKRHQGKGYAKQILGAILKKAFEEFDLHRIYLIVRPEKEKSIFIYKKCGFEREGILYDKYKINGQWIDMLQMVILKRWWELWWKKEGG